MLLESGVQFSSRYLCLFFVCERFEHDRAVPLGIGVVSRESSELVKCLFWRCSEAGFLYVFDKYIGLVREWLKKVGSCDSFGEVLIWSSNWFGIDGNRLCFFMSLAKDSFVCLMNWLTNVLGFDIYFSANLYELLCENVIKVLVRDYRSFI
jgi:hypothetical protein